MRPLFTALSLLAILTPALNAQVVLRDTVVPSRPSICNDPAVHEAKCSGWRLVSRHVDLNRLVGHTVELTGRDITPPNSRCHLLEVVFATPIRFVQDSQTHRGTASMAVSFTGTGGMEQRYLLFLAGSPARHPFLVHGVDGPWMLPPHAMIYAGTHVPQGPNNPYLVVRVPNDPALHGIPIFDQAIVVSRTALGLVIATTNLDCFAF